MTKEERFENFKEKSAVLHPRGNIDLSEFVYVNNRTPSVVIDHDLRPDGSGEYGRFMQTPSNHLKGQEHPDKRAEKISKSKRLDWKEIVRRCREAHKAEKLEYPEQSPRNLHDKIRIIDHDLNPNGEEYGEYVQELNSHLKGCVHPQKALDKSSARQRYDTEKFIELAKKVHSGHNYDYSECNYIDHRQKVKIYCKKIGSNGKAHGFFHATPDNFLQGKGCPKCGNHLSYGEEEITAHLVEKGVKIERNKHNILDGLEIDIYCPELKFGIEFNGLRWHTERFGKGRNYHLNKTEKANEKGIKLIQVFEDEWINNKELVLNKIDRILKIGNKKTVIGARKCSVTEITKKDAKSFLEKNHIQGFSASTVYYGALFNNNIVSVMSFKKNGEEYELTRFATDIGYSFPGLASKMFKFFLKETNPSIVKSFADRRWTVDKDDNLYTKLGFRLEDIEKPDYRYVVRNERRHKFGFRKNILHKKYGLSLSLTEKEMCDELGFYRIWNCGLFKYLWKRSN